MLKIERFDHMHIRPADYERFTEAFEKIMGKEFMLKTDMPPFGTLVNYEPFPVGLELFKPYAPEKSIVATRAAETEGVFVLSFKVSDIKEGQAEMEALGYKMLEFYDNNPILEALYDTKADFGFDIELVQSPF